MARDAAQYEDEKLYIMVRSILLNTFILFKQFYIDNAPMSSSKYQSVSQTI